MPRAHAGTDPIAYAGASLKTRDLVSWNPGRRSADADLLPNVGPLIGRSRDLQRNSGVARGGIQTVVDNVVGVGLRLNPNPNYRALGKSREWADEFSRAVRAEWYGWAETTACDAADTMIFDQLTGQTLRAQLSDGDGVAIAQWIPDRGDGWSTKMQTIDPDRMSTPLGLTESATLRGGIQLDSYGAPLGAWIRRTHPADYAGVSGSISDYGKWEFVPKRNEFGRRVLIHCYDKERTGQTRGKPILSSVLSNFKGLDRYTAAEIQAAVINAMVAMVIETPLDQTSIEALFKDDEAKYLQYRREHAVAIESGSTLALFPGDKATSFAPSRPAPGFESFQKNVGRIIALAYDMPYEYLFKDFTGANYSSMRAAMLEAWRSFNRRRDDLGTQWADPVYMLWLEEAVNTGKIDAPDFYANPYAYARCTWIGPGRGWVDPLREAQAAGERMKARISTLRDECAEQGKDWQDQLEQQATEREFALSLGLPDPLATPAPMNAFGGGDPGSNDNPDAADPTDGGHDGGQPTNDKPTPPAQRATAANGLANRVATLETMLAATLAKETPAPVVTIGPDAIKVEHHAAPISIALPEGRISTESEVLETDRDGNPSLVRETYIPPGTKKAPAPGTVLSVTETVVAERDADDRIRKTVKTELAS